MTTATRHVRLFRNGRNQAVRIPREFELPGDEAVLTREGDAIVLRPVPKRSLLGLLASMEPLDIDLPDPLDPQPEAVDL